MTSYLIAVVICLISTSYAYRVPAITSCKSAGTYLASGTLLCSEGQDIAVSHDTEYKGSQCDRLGNIIFSEKVYPLTFVVCSTSENRVAYKTVGVVYEWKKYQIVRKVFDGRKRSESACPLKGDYLPDQTHLCHNHELIKVEYVKDNDRFCDKDEPAIMFSLTDNTPREFDACVRVNRRSRASKKYRYATESTPLIHELPYTEISTDSTTFPYGKRYLKGCGTNRKIIPLTTNKGTTICYDRQVYTLTATDDWRNVNCNEGEIQRYSDVSKEEFEICEHYLSGLAFRSYTEKPSRRGELSALKNSKQGLMRSDYINNSLKRSLNGCGKNRKIIPLTTSKVTTICYNEKIYTLNATDDWRNVECNAGEIKNYSDDSNEKFEICEQYLNGLAFRLYTEKSRRGESSARKNSKRGRLVDTPPSHFFNSILSWEPTKGDEPSVRKRGSLVSLIHDNSLHNFENMYEKCSASVRELYFIDATRTTARVCFNQQVKSLSFEEEELLDEECEVSSISMLPDRRDGKKYFKICVYNEYKRLVNRVFSFQWVEYFNEKMTAKKNTIPEKRGFTAEKRGVMTEKVMSGPDLFCGNDIFFEDGSVTFISREENTAKVCDSGVEVGLFKTGAIIDGLSCTSRNQVSKESSEIYCVCEPVLAGTTLHGCPAYTTKTNEKQIYGDTGVTDPVVSEKNPCYGFEGLKIISGKTTDDVITICVNEKFVNLQISQETWEHVKCSPTDSKTAIATIVNQAGSYAICQPNNMYKIYSQV